MQRNIVEIETIRIVWASIAVKVYVCEITLHRTSARDKHKLLFYFFMFYGEVFFLLHRFCHGAYIRAHTYIYTVTLLLRMDLPVPVHGSYQFCVYFVLFFFFFFRRFGGDGGGGCSHISSAMCVI